jgi:nitrite reductase/ring-hydroxylating ferredoxin subunit
VVTRAPFLKTRFGGYYVPKEDAELTHIGPGTPCGEYMRCFWQPVCFSDELRDLPHRVKILGEDLVVFRDESGAVGLLELHCPHRGTSLEFGLIDAKGIRGCYYGWLFAPDGTILETPGEPADSTLKDRLITGLIRPMSIKASCSPIWGRRTDNCRFRCMTASTVRAIV